jgi:heterodisulfide reductase subunit A
VGNFTVRFRCSGGDIEEVKAGALVLATGYDHYQPRTGELGYGESPAVVTLPDFQRLLASAPAAGLQVDGKPIHSVAFVHCVGSRQTEGVDPPAPDGKINDYCSRVCCTAAMYTINQALDRFPDLQIYDLYRDIRTYGRGQEEYYESASKRGALFFRFTPDSPVRFTAANGNGSNSLTLVDTLTWGEELTIPTDLVVLVTGMVPRDISNLVGMLKLPVGADRFLQEVHPKLRPVELANNGIVVAGACQGPMDIMESCAAAEAAAVKVSILLANPTINLDPFVARVNEERCDGCEKCLAECSYTGALTMVEREGGRRVVSVNPAVCAGCGACVAVCPPRALDLAGWSLDQFDAMVDAISNDLVLIPA